jgi:hypothetical protein
MEASCIVIYLFISSFIHPLIRSFIGPREAFSENHDVMGFVSVPLQFLKNLSEAPVAHAYNPSYLGG